jgi:hypothetical protein
MVQSPFWAADWFAASKEIPRISPNPKVHYRTHKRPPPVSILDQSNPVHILTSHLLGIHPNIIHPSTHRSPQWSISLRFPHQDPIRPPLLTHTPHIPSPSHSCRFYHPHNIGWGVQITNTEINTQYIGERLENSGYKSWQQQQIFLFFKTPRVALGHTLPHAKLVRGSKWSRSQTDHSPPCSTKVKKNDCSYI